MDFELSDDQRLLAEGIRRLCAGRFPLERLRAQEGRRELDTELWAALADAGVFSLTMPEDDGGLGLGLGHAAVVFEELGRALVPGPTVATHLAASLVEGAATGDAVVGLVLDGPSGAAPPALPVLVEDLGSLDALLVVGDGGVSMVDPAGLDAVPVERAVDPLTPLWRVDRLPEGSALGGPDMAAALRRDHRVLCGAVLVGMAATTTEMAVEYAKGREQFGRPIGSFQAVKHLCADMLVRAAVARSAVHAAAVTVDQPDVGDAERAAAGAALLSAEAALANAKACIQVHGGMGFTWEVPAHLYLMRTRVVAQSLDPPGPLADTVAARFSQDLEES